jgi:hypothetical protein
MLCGEMNFFFSTRKFRGTFLEIPPQYHMFGKYLGIKLFSFLYVNVPKTFLHVLYTEASEKDVILGKGEIKSLFRF